MYVVSLCSNYRIGILRNDWAVRVEIGEYEVIIVLRRPSINPAFSDNASHSRYEADVDSFYSKEVTLYIAEEVADAIEEAMAELYSYQILLR